MLTLTELCYPSRGLGPLSLSLEAGQVVLLCGPSGSGKSTLCGLITGDLEPASGTVARPPRVGTMRGDVESQLLGSSVGQELELGRLAGRSSADRRVVDLSTPDLTSTSAPRPPAQLLSSLAQRWEGRDNEDPQALSSGEQHLLLLSSLALGSFPLLVLDEGLSCLDQESFQEICARLRALALEGVLVVLVSHELRILPWVDRCLGLSGGRLVLDKAAASMTGTDLCQLRIWTGTLSLAPEHPVLGAEAQLPATGSFSELETGPSSANGAGTLEHEGGLQVPMSGGVLALAGPTGSGKSRLLGSMSGLDILPGWQFRPGASSIVLLPQPAISVLWHRSVAAELRASLLEGKRRGGCAGDDVPEIPADWRPRSPRSLSHGQAKFLACLCLLLQRPDLLLLDEPFSGLDADLRQHLERRLRAYLAAGGRLIMSTHHPDEMVLYASRLLVLDQGKPQYLGVAWEFFESRPDGPLGRPYCRGL